MKHCREFDMSYQSKKQNKGVQNGEVNSSKSMLPNKDWVSKRPLRL